MEHIVFNIIYTPNTVNVLWKFTESIVNHTGIKIRIISNHCTEEEILFLKQTINSNPQLELYVHDTNELVPHHDILNKIYELDKESTFFCFMDSDIFITKNVVLDFLEEMKNNSALYTGEPILHTKGLKCDGVNSLQGRHFFAKNGTLVGASYCTIYRRKDLDMVIKKTGLMFDRKEWTELSVDIKSKLNEMDLKYESYDTGKLLNIFLGYYGYNHTYYSSENLYHIGGISDTTSTPSSWNIFFLLFYLSKTTRELFKVSSKRKKIANYFTALIKSLKEDKKRPKLVDVSNDLEKAKLEKTTKEIISLYNND